MLLCHPHPLYGGDRFAPVVDVLYRRLPAQGVAVLRFDFRGVGSSGGSHGGGVDEQLDVVAALAALADAVPDVPVVLGGWSFGADVSLAVADERHHGWFAVAPPLSVVDAEAMAAPSDPRPKALAVPEHDQFNPPERANAVTASWVNAEVTVVPGADHFLAGRLGLVEAAALEAVGNVTGRRP